MAESYTPEVESQRLIDDLFDWSRANARARDIPARPENIDEIAAVEDEAAALRWSVSSVLSGGGRLTSWEPVGETQQKLVDNLGAIIKDPEFKAHSAAVEFLAHDITSHWRDVNKLSESLSGEEDPRYKEAKENYEGYKTLIMPLVADATHVAARTGNREELSTIFECLKNTDEPSVAENLLYMPDLTQDQRLDAVVAHINSFGFIATVDAIARAANANDVDDGLRQQLKAIYSEIQGEEASRISAELTEIYQRINFAEYAMNSQELTRREADMLVEVSGIGPDSVIVDVGAGVGRHAGELSGRGFANITALESERAHIRHIQENYPGVRAVQGNWGELVNLTGIDGEADLTYILGRSITHNRTANEMLHCMDQMVRATKDGGTIVLDFEDADWEDRQKRIEALQENLSRLGVRVPENGTIFDGPSESERFNRLIWNSEQVQAMADLMGLTLTEVRKEDIGEGMKDAYYILKKKQDYWPGEVDHQKVMDSMRTLGLISASSDLNQMMDAWGMTTGQAFLYGLDNDDIRLQNKKGEGPKVVVQARGTELDIYATQHRRRPKPPSR